VIHFIYLFPLQQSTHSIIATYTYTNANNQLFGTSQRHIYQPI
jgi:hypothetical protein